MYLQRWHGWCHMKLQPSAQVLCTPYNHAPCHLMQSHILVTFALLPWHQLHPCPVTITLTSPVSCHNHLGSMIVSSLSLQPSTFLSLSLRVSHVPDIFTSSSLAITFTWLTLLLLLPFNPCPATLIKAFLCNATITCAQHSFLGLILPNTIFWPHPCSVFFHPSWSTGSFSLMLLSHFVHDLDVSWIR